MRRCVICSDYTFGCCTPIKYSHLHENWPLLLVWVIYIDRALGLGSTSYSCVRTLWGGFQPIKKWAYIKTSMLALPPGVSRDFLFYLKNTLKNLSSSSLRIPFFCRLFFIILSSHEIRWGFWHGRWDSRSAVSQNLSVCWDYQSTPHNSHLVPSTYHQYCSKPDYFLIMWVSTMISYCICINKQLNRYLIKWPWRYIYNLSRSIYCVKQGETFWFKWSIVWI